MTEHQSNNMRSSPKNAHYRTAKGNAKRDGKEFTIELSDVPDIPKHCPVLGFEFVMDGKHNDHAPSLDRVDNSKGYVPGNVAFISRRANRIKGDASLDELIKLGNFCASFLKPNGKR